ncbi:MAG: RNA polymerase sigma factor [Pseudomonadota bacterium]
MNADAALDRRSGVLERLYNEHFDRLVAFLQATFGSGPPPPEDIAQQTFEKLWRSGALDRVDYPRALLWRAARNLALSERQSERARDRREQLAAQPDSDDRGYHSTPDRVIGARQSLSTVMKVLHAMPDRRREVFLLVRVDGLSHTEVAARLEISRPAVSKHVALALAQLTEALDDE